MSNETEFSRKMKKLAGNRAVIVTAVTLLVVAGVIIAATVSANRAKKPLPDDPAVSGTSEPTGTQSAPSGVGDVTLPTYNGGETKPVGADPEEPDGIFSLPVSGQLYKGHDATIQVYSNTMGDYRVHLGVDIATAPEAPVFAAADGKVEKIWEDSMMGTCVAVTHKDDTVSIYKNLAPALSEGITAGTAVKQGQQLGIVGDTAVVEMADEPHLHFEMTVGGLAQDPLDYFEEQAVATLAQDNNYED